MSSEWNKQTDEDGKEQKMMTVVNDSEDEKAESRREL